MPRFVTLFGQTWSDAGYPVKAIAPYMGRIAGPVEQSGGLTVPSFFVTAENDFTSPPGPIIADYNDTAFRRHAGESAWPRSGTSRAVASCGFPGSTALRHSRSSTRSSTTGAWNGAGERIVTIDEAVVRASNAQLPSSVNPQRAGIADQCALVLAVHQMRADYKVPMANFFADFL